LGSRSEAADLDGGEGLIVHNQIAVDIQDTRGITRCQGAIQKQVPLQVAGADDRAALANIDEVGNQGAIDAKIDNPGAATAYEGSVAAIVHRGAAVGDGERGGGAAEYADLQVGVNIETPATGDVGHCGTAVGAAEVDTADVELGTVPDGELRVAGRAEGVGGEADGVGVPAGAGTADGDAVGAAGVGKADFDVVAGQELSGTESHRELCLHNI